MMGVHQPRRHQAAARVDDRAVMVKPLAKLDDFAAVDPDIGVPKLRPGVVHGDDAPAFRIRSALTPPRRQKRQRLGMERRAGGGQHAPAAMGRAALPVGDDAARASITAMGAQMS
jgi:hypothetical protein